MDFFESSMHFLIKFNDLKAFTEEIQALKLTSQNIEKNGKNLVKFFESSMHSLVNLITIKQLLSN